MSSDIGSLAKEHKPIGSPGLARLLADTDFSNCCATVVGYGNMGKEYVKALRTLGVGRIRVCSRSQEPLEELQGLPGVTALPGGFEGFHAKANPGELGIVATPIHSLAACARSLAEAGFNRLLIEKPIALWSEQIEQLWADLQRDGVEAACAYNRVAYPSFREVAYRAAQEGGIRSCTYTFTERVKPDWPQRFPPEELARWGIANSLHVIGMAHGLIGLAEGWTGYRGGYLSWHPTGSVFVGCGISDLDIPFSYHADWTSTGRWSLEVHTPAASYRLCPLEQAFRKASGDAAWEPLPVEAYAQSVKAGFVEEVAAMLDPHIREVCPLFSIKETARLTRFAEEIFGYSSHA